jgi:lysophospholipase L1-like esterase
MPEQSVPPSDSRLSWQGAVSVQHTPEWSQPWRLPHSEISLFPPDVLVDRAAMPAGVRLTFRSDTTLVAGTFEPQAELAPLDLYVDGEWMGSAPLERTGTFRFDGIHAHAARRERLFELWLPQFGRFRLSSLRLSDGASLAKHRDERKRWVTYGSSITQCRTASSPSFTWPGVVARGLDVHLTCLGYGGQCHLDPMVARVVRELPADYLSMCVGINIYGSGSLNARTFQPGIIGFVKIVREKHPVTPFVVMSPIFSPPREAVKNKVDFTLQEMREEVQAAVAALRAHGDEQVHYVDGLAVFGTDLGHLLPDELHPSAEGYKVMGRNFLERVARRYFH